MALTDSQIRKQTSKWFHENSRPNWFHQKIISVLKCGEIPKHIAIIMDGNRRYAKKECVQRQVGHMKGFDKLTETLEWCLDLGINEVTVYAFSIENFKRSADEVGGLMDLLRVKLQDLVDDREKLEEHGVKVRVLGDISLMPADIQKLIAQAVSLSSEYNRAFLNVCIAYTSREEMTSAIKLVADGLVNGKLQESDVTSSLLQSCLYTSSCQPVDLVVRTSGEVRLSDFLLWQSSYSLLSFVHVMWPDFSRWDLYGAVLHYQHHISRLRAIEKSHKILVSDEENINTPDSSSRKSAFLDDVTRRRTEKLESLLT
ncbi:dehydrodolichyl diphosphate synthase complex subunit DHDDS-like [Watersipora subatra]|uniref:dehydrodolichyl diphosphate synthase complex subunit DHDDS-like n=1 Tax=Watersipora subatra TaxID=2589382 RepID=UPI00355C33CD